MIYNVSSDAIKEKVMRGKIIKDMFVTFSATIFTAVFGFLSSILIARLLGPEKQGAVKIIILLPTLMLTFMNFGIDSAILYFSAKEKCFQSMDRTINKITGFFLLFVAVIGPAVILAGRNYFQNIPLVYLFSVLLLVPLNFYQATQTALIRAENFYMKYNLINAVKQTVYFAVILLIVFYKSIWIVIAANYAMVATGIFMCKFKSHHEDQQAVRPFLKDLLKYGGKTYTSSVVNFLNYRFDDIYLKPFVNLSNLGIYTVAQTLSEQIWMIPNSASVVLLPRLAAMDEEQKKNVSLRVCRHIATIMFVISGLVIWLSAYLFPLIYSNKYNDSILPFRILMIGTFLMSYGKILGNAIAAYGKPEKNIAANIAGSLSNVLLNLFMIPKYGILGAAIAGTISYSILSIVTVIMFIRTNRTKVKIVDLLFMNKRDFKELYRMIRNRLRKAPVDAGDSPTL
jgi:O-antigen/teichoic acid export membrane protein